MDAVKLTIFKVFALRLWMLATRTFVFFALIRAEYFTPHPLYVIAACISLPLIFIALWRVVETASQYVRIKPDIESLRREAAKEANKEYLKKM